MSKQRNTTRDILVWASIFRYRSWEKRDFEFERFHESPFWKK